MISISKRQVFTTNQKIGFAIRAIYRDDYEPMISLINHLKKRGWSDQEINESIRQVAADFLGETR